jgi:glycosyltransferase involved in cell wall biosynthesis
VPEVVTDGETGCLSAVGDTDKMGADAAALLADEEELRAMGTRARQSALERYNTDLVIPQYLEFYERILNASGD